MRIVRNLKVFISTRGKSQFLLEVIIAIMLLSMPFWFEGLSSLLLLENEIQLFGFHFPNNDYINAQAKLWTIIIKLTPLSISVLWYLTCRHWWRFAIIVPLSFSLFQLVQVFTDNHYIDEREFLYALAFSLPIIVSIVWLTNKLYYYRKYIILRSEINCQMEGFLIKFKCEDIEKFKEVSRKLDRLELKKSYLSKETYIVRLIELRNSLLDNSEVLKYNPKNHSVFKDVLVSTMLERFILIAILLWPLLSYVYMLFPEVDVVHIFGLTINAIYYDYINVTIWTIFGKISLILLLSLWFFTNKNWWRFSMLPMLSLSFFQTCTIFYEGFIKVPIKRFNDFEGVIFPLFFVTISYLFIDLKLKYNPIGLKDRLEKRTKDILNGVLYFKKNNYIEVKRTFDEVQIIKPQLTEKEYLHKLMALQKSIIKNGEITILIFFLIPVFHYQYSQVVALSIN